VHQILMISLISCALYFGNLSVEESEVLRMTDMHKLRFARQLKVSRLRHNWTQGYVAEKIGTTTVNVSRWERGLLCPVSIFARDSVTSSRQTRMSWDY